MKTKAKALKARGGAPEHLSDSSKQLWKSIKADYQIDEAAETILLAMLEALDRREQAREMIAKEGPVVLDRWGQRKAHPSIAIERDSASTLAKCFRMLGMDQEPRGEMGRPAGGRHVAD